MTGRDKVPAKTTSGHLILPKEHPGSLVARGLHAVANRQRQQPLITVERNAESLTLDAFAAFVTYKNFAKALELASKAAEQGHAHAYYVLGFIYSFGGDGEGDCVLAFMWDTLAVKYLLEPNYSTHRDDAMRHLDFLKRRMTPAQIREAEQLASRKAAELGDAEQGGGAYRNAHLAETEDKLAKLEPQVRAAYRKAWDAIHHRTK
jgi:TPR repeat protein